MKGNFDLKWFINSTVSIILALQFGFNCLKNLDNMNLIILDHVFMRILIPYIISHLLRKKTLEIYIRLNYFSCFFIHFLVIIHYFIYILIIKIILSEYFNYFNFFRFFINIIDYLYYYLNLTLINQFFISIIIIINDNYKIKYLMFLQKFFHFTH
jgi:hypothetical protein